MLFSSNFSLLERKCRKSNSCSIVLLILSYIHARLTPATIQFRMNYHLMITFEPRARAHDQRSSSGGSSSISFGRQVLRRSNIRSNIKNTCTCKADHEADACICVSIKLQIYMRRASPRSRECDVLNNQMFSTMFVCNWRGRMNTSSGKG